MVFNASTIFWAQGLSSAAGPLAAVRPQRPPARPGRARAADHEEPAGEVGGLGGALAATTESRTNPHPTNHQDHLGRGVSEVDGRNDLSRNVDAINREEPLDRTRGPQHNHLGRWTVHCRGQEGEANGDDKHRDRVHQPVVGLTPGGQMMVLAQLAVEGVSMLTSGQIPVARK